MLNWFYIPHDPYAVSGKAFNPAAHTNCRGRMQIDDGQLVVEGRAGRAALPIDGIRAERNRWLGGPIRFTNRDEPEWTLSTRDERILRDPRFTGGRGLLRKSRVHFHYSRRALKLACFAFLLTMIFVPPARQYVTGQAVALIPVENDLVLGDHLYRALQHERGIVDDAAAPPELGVIAARLSQALSEKDRRFAIHVHLAANPSVNAFALPGGHIVVNSGLILEARSADELAGVLGHEMGHVTHRHAMRHLVEAAGVWALIRGMAGDTRGWEGAAAGMGLVLTRLSFSRDDEREADRAGWQYLRQAHLRSSSLQDFFMHLSKSDDSVPPEVRLALQMLSTHPMTRERIMELQELARTAPDDLAVTPLEMDFEGLQKSVRALQEASVLRTVP